MERLTVDSALLTRLEQVQWPVVICDSSGATVGYFTPIEKYSPEMYAWARAQISDEELSRRAAKPGSRSTAEVLKRLTGE